METKYKDLHLFLYTLKIYFSRLRKNNGKIEFFLGNNYEQALDAIFHENENYDFWYKLIKNSIDDILNLIGEELLVIEQDIIFTSERYNLKNFLIEEIRRSFNILVDDDFFTCLVNKRSQSYRFGYLIRVVSKPVDALLLWHSTVLGPRIYNNINKKIKIKISKMFDDI